MEVGRGEVVCTAAWAGEAQPINRKTSIRKRKK